MSEISFVGVVGNYNGQFRLTIPKKRFSEMFEEDSEYVVKIKKLEVEEI